jgi:hypothetical protein
MCNRNVLSRINTAASLRFITNLSSDPTQYLHLICLLLCAEPIIQTTQHNFPCRFYKNSWHFLCTYTCSVINTRVPNTLYFSYGWQTSNLCKRLHKYQPKIWSSVCQVNMQTFVWLASCYSLRAIGFMQRVASQTEQPTEQKKVQYSIWRNNRAN